MVTKGFKVPITPSVLRWAIAESGYSLEEVADRIAVPAVTLAEWATEGAEDRPSPGQVRELATVLKRTPATLLLPTPPSIQPSLPQFRNRGGRTSPNAEERRYVREAGRLQRTASWLVTELGRAKPAIPYVQVDRDPEEVAADVRRELDNRAPSSTHTAGTGALTPSQAFRAWRGAVEDGGVLVFLFSMGADAVAGFSLWDDAAPVIAINTSANHEARSFTLWHEYGHLLTRTSSLCLETDGSRLTAPTEPLERWCERFAAAVLLPWDRVASVLTEMGHREGRPIVDLNVSKAIAKRFNVSWRAATLRLIEHHAATWDLYRQIPTRVEAKTRGGPTTDEGGRDRAVVRENQYGERTIELFIDAAERNVLSRMDVLDYLDLPDTALDRLKGNA